MEKINFEDIKLIFEALLILSLCVATYYWVWRPKEKKQEKKFDKNYHKVFGEITKKLKEK